MDSRLLGAFFGHDIGAVLQCLLDAMHTNVPVLFERVLALVAAAFRMQVSVCHSAQSFWCSLPDCSYLLCVTPYKAFEVPVLVQKKAGGKRSKKDMSSRAAARYANEMMGFVHDE